MSNKLFQDFDSVSSKQWKQKIQVDLKGADYNEALIWTSPEGIALKPFYHLDEQDGVVQVSSYSSTWKVGQTIYVADVEKANKKAKDALKRGAESITFILPQETTELSLLFDSLDSETITLVPLFLSETVIASIP